MDFKYLAPNRTVLARRYAVCRNCLPIFMDLACFCLILHDFGSSKLGRGGSAWTSAPCTLPQRAPLGLQICSQPRAKDGEVGRVCSYCADDCHSCATAGRCLECNNSMYLDESFKCAALSPLAKVIQFDIRYTITIYSAYTSCTCIISGLMRGVSACPNGYFGQATASRASFCPHGRGRMIWGGAAQAVRPTAAPARAQASVWTVPRSIT